MSISSLTKQVVQEAQVLTKGHFIFADGDHALMKLEMDHLWEHPKQLGLIINLLAQADGLPSAEVIIGVPTGGQRLAELVAQQLQLPLSHLERVPGGAKQDFRFVSKKDEQLALSAHSVRIYEDVVTTLSSIAGVVRLLEPDRQAIHSLAIWRRGEVKPHYKDGVSDHYLVEELLKIYPADKCPICSHKQQ